MARKTAKARAKDTQRSKRQKDTNYQVELANDLQYFHNCFLLCMLLFSYFPICFDYCVLSSGRANFGSYVFSFWLLLASSTALVLSRCHFVRHYEFHYLEAIFLSPILLVLFTILSSVLVSRYTCFSSSPLRIRIFLFAHVNSCHSSFFRFNF